MADEAIELFIHSQGAKPKVAVAGPHEVLRDVLVRGGSDNRRPARDCWSLSASGKRR